MSEKFCNFVAMKFRRFLFIIIAALIALAATNYIAPAEARTKARTSQSSKSKKKSRSKLRRSSSKSKKKSGSKKSKKSKKSKNSQKGTSATRKRTGASGSSYSAPKETPQNDSLTLAVNSAVLANIPAKQNPGGLRVNSVKTDSRNRTARLSLNENFTYLPVTTDLIKNIEQSASKALPDSIRDFKISLNVGNRSLAYYISKIDKLPADKRKNIPFVVAAAPYTDPRHGMQGDIIALWHSHGRYFRPGSGAWMWQRPFLFETAEDVFTGTFILPYTVPMIENAGGYVMLPRERDPSPHEVIVDNDTYEGGMIYSQPYYKEMNGSKAWSTGSEEGFIYDLPDFRDTENPFENGTYRQVATVKGGSPSVAAWYADIPEDGEYAVYVSYKTLPESTTDAHYTVNYSGGTREFRVNQTMGGSTWIYLGTFPFKAGYSDQTPTVTLTNITEKGGQTIVTADAVKIGGGMGNIARSNRRSDIYYDPSTPLPASSTAAADEKPATEKQVTPADDDNDGDDEDDEDDDEDDDDDDDDGDDEDSDDADDTGDVEDESPDGESDASLTAPAAAAAKKGPAPTFRTSGMTRFVEGARYWLQWAGIPENIYSPYHGSDDYKDDYTSRGHWVNYLAGGSRVLPNKEGLNIPVDAVMALHSDAGLRHDDSFVGTLGIYFSNNGASYADGTPRMNSRMLTDMIMRQITGDVRQSLEPRWSRRSMWDKSYVEARVPEVPTALIELLSHQNYADMMYGNDPHFKFLVGRAIYKAIGRFVSERKDREFIVQPLPVNSFAIKQTKKGHYRLEWKATPDSLEPTAMPTHYVIFERTGDDLGFHRIGETKNTHYDFRTDDNLIHSFKIVAANEGGISFPSEILTMREAKDEKNPILIINGFERISAPGHFSENGRAGFNSQDDFGVPYIQDIGFTGHQTEFRRSAGNSFGNSGTNYVQNVIAGNTFDYPMIHGRALTAAGHGFVSASAKAVEDGEVKLSGFKTIDYILGKQKMTVIGNGKSSIRYRSFSPKMQQLLTDYTDHGGRLMVSGQYVASDLFDKRASEGSLDFAEDILGITMDSIAPARTRSGRISTVGGAFGSKLPTLTADYSNTLNPKQYIVENPDVLKASEGTEAVVMMQFTDTKAPAGLLTRRDKSRGAVMSIPFESIKDAADRNALMKAIIDWLED